MEDAMDFKRFAAAALTVVMDPPPIEIRLNAVGVEDDRGSKTGEQSVTVRNSCECRTDTFRVTLLYLLA